MPQSPTNPRVRFIAYLSVDEGKVVAVSDFIGRELSRVFAGATLFPATGYWAEDGSAYKAEYAGPIRAETAVAIHLTVLPQRREEALAHLRATARAAVARFGLLAHDLHVESDVTEAFHTDLDSDADA